MNLKAIIVDDEPGAREKLQLLIGNYCNEKVLIAAVCANAKEGLEAIAMHKPDVVFLDIEMPGMTGFDLLKQVPKVDFDVVFTTAHDHYAIRAIKFSALDYLLKPIDLEQLQEAVDKAIEKRSVSKDYRQYESFIENISGTNKALENLSIPTSTGLVFVKLSEIVRCEAINNYTCFKLLNTEEVIATRTMKEYEELLSDSGFIRIHHSHMINRQYLKRYIKGAGGQVEMADGSTLDVSRRKKDEVMQRLKN